MNAFTLELRMENLEKETSVIHALLVERLNEIDIRLISGDVRANRQTGKIKFSTYEMWDERISFTDYPEWDGDSGANFSVTRDVLFDQESHDRAVARLDAEEAKSKEDEAQAILDQEARNRESRRASYLKLKEEFGDEEG